MIESTPARDAYSTRAADEPDSHLYLLPLARCTLLARPAARLPGGSINKILSAVARARAPEGPTRALALL